MQRQDNDRADRPYSGTPETPAQATESLGNEDCVVMLDAIRQRVAGLVAPLANGHAPTGPPDYRAFASRMALDECDAALRQLLGMVRPLRGGAEQLVLDAAELRVALSGARNRL